MNHQEKILNHFKKKKSITSWEAIQKYGNTRLADTIFNLKDKGHNIMTINEHKDGKRWARYVYMGVK